MVALLLYTTSAFAITRGSSAHSALNLAKGVEPGAAIRSRGRAFSKRLFLETPSQRILLIFIQKKFSLSSSIIIQMILSHSSPGTVVNPPLNRPAHFSHTCNIPIIMLRARDIYSILLNSPNQFCLRFFHFDNQFFNLVFCKAMHQLLKTCRDFGLNMCLRHTFHVKLSLINLFDLPN